MPLALRIIGDTDTISQLAKLPPSNDLKIGKPQPAEAMTDAADGVIGPQEIHFGLQLLTLGFGTASSLAVFVAKIIDIKNKLQKGRSIQIVNARNGKTQLTINPDTDDNDIRDTLSYPQ